RRRALDDQGADLLGDRHHLVEPEPALVAAPSAARAPHRVVGLEIGVRGEAVLLEHPGGEDRPPLAVLAKGSREALGDDTVDRALVLTGPSVLPATCYSTGSSIVMMFCSGVLTTPSAA